MISIRSDYLRNDCSQKKTQVEVKSIASNFHSNNALPLLRHQITIKATWDQFH